MNYTPIETIHNGYRFRSRAEARWSVFFTALGIPYEYEKEGYDLDGLRYLPDFYLPTLKAWVEIKGEEPTLEERLKARCLALATGEEVYILAGSPWFNIARAFYVPSEHLPYGVMDFSYYDPSDPWTERDWVEKRNHYPWWTTWMFTDKRGLFLACLWENDCVPLAHHPKLVTAYQVARQYRFESRESQRARTTQEWSHR